jgi:hypothetical protein
MYSCDVMCFMYERNLLYKYSFVCNLCCKILMYPVLILTHVLDFLDTSGMGVTIGIRAGRFRPCLGSLNYN